MKGTLREDLSSYMMSGWIILRMRNVFGKTL